jgi:hypothetical protein
MDGLTRVALFRSQFRTHGHLTLSRELADWLFDAAERGIERGHYDAHVVIAKAYRPPPRLVRLTAEHGRR